MTLRPALAALAADPAATSVRRLWKALTPEERVAGITACLTDDEDGWVKNRTRSAVAAALKFRPQTVATWPRTKIVAEAARLPIDDAQLLSGYIVDLHLGLRRPMMAEFLDSLGIANENGRIDSEATVVPQQDADGIRTAADVIAARYPREDVVIYLLTLLLQDNSIWGGAADWLVKRAHDQP
ncbi:MAG: hypothetical protein JWM95_4233 [Gemmatimonadetes bacterium]|nr:hypothetical protein [Gemmatimonadota bacterium]